MAGIDPARVRPDRQEVLDPRLRRHALPEARRHGNLRAHDGGGRSGRGQLFRHGPGLFRGQERAGLRPGLPGAARLGLPFYCATKTFEASRPASAGKSRSSSGARLPAVDFYHAWCIRSRKTGRSARPRARRVATHQGGRPGAPYLRVQPPDRGRNRGALSEELFEGVLFGYSAHRPAKRPSGPRRARPRGDEPWRGRSRRIRGVRLPAPGRTGHRGGGAAFPARPRAHHHRAVGTPSTHPAGGAACPPARSSGSRAPYPMPSRSCAPAASTAITARRASPCPS
jgi:hypothetical protein